MKTKTLRLLSLILTAALCLSMLVGIVGAADDENNYLAVTERGNYASGVHIVFDAGIQLIGGHEYTLDIDIAVATDKTQTLRVMVEDAAFGNITTGATPDAGGVRGITVNTGWNEFRALAFTAKATSRFAVKIHSDSSGTEDFFIDNLRIYDVTDSKEIINFDFENPNHINFCHGIDAYDASQTVKAANGPLPGLVVPEIPDEETDLERITEPDDQYLSVTERTLYASGVVFKPGIKLEKGHTYRVDMNIYIADNYQKFRFIIENQKGGDITVEEGSDICGQRGFIINHGWNTMSNLTFTAASSEIFNLKIHSDSAGTSDFYVDNFYIRDVTAKEDLLYMAFDKAEDIPKIKGMDYNGSSQKLSVPGFEFPEWKPEDEIKYKTHGIVINEDFDSLSSMSESTTEESIRNFVRSWEGSHVTDYMLNIYSQIPAYPSEVATDIIDKYHRTEEQGQAVNYKNDSDVKMGKLMFEDKGIDYIKVMMEELPKAGINPWISFRMNDAHNIAYKPFMFHYSDFFYENPQFRRVLHGSTTNSYYNGLLDFSHEEVRDYWLAILNEALSRYDCYGLELDFQREIWLWHTGGEYVGLTQLTEFMRELDRIVKIYEVKYGHDIKVGIRCASDIQTNYDFGYDVITWAAEGLIDLVNPTARYITTDFDVPVKSWVSIMHPFGVEVAPGLETIILGDLGGQTPRSDLLTASAAAANWYEQGADKIYLYNHFLRCGTAGFSQSDRRDIDMSVTTFSSIKGKWNAMITLGSYEKTLMQDRRMILTFNDTKQTWANSNAQLPTRAYPNGENALIHMPLGTVPDGASAIFNIAVNSFNVEKVPNVIINGERAEYVGVYSEGNEYVTETILSYRIPESAYDDMYITAEMTSSCNKFLTIPYVEIFIDAVQ